MEASRQRDAQLDAALAQLDAGRALAALADELAALVRPRQPLEVLDDLRALLRLLEHPTLAHAAREGHLPDAVSAAALEALEVLMPALGVRPVGALDKLAREARRVLDAEQRKFEIITSRAADVTTERLTSMLAGYVSTAPAPTFVARLRQRYPDVMSEAERRWRGQREVDVPRRGELLAQPRARLPLEDLDAMASALTQAAQVFEGNAARLRPVLAQGGEDEVLLGALIAGWLGARELANPILDAAIGTSADVPMLGVIATSLAPQMARQVFSLTLADASWGNPEEPENELTPARARVVLTARCLLPELGSPLAALELDEDAIAREYGEELSALPARVARLRERWAALLARRATA